MKTRTEWIVCIIIFLILGAVLFPSIPLERTSSYICPYCKAEKCDRQAFRSSTSRIKEGNLAEYWRKSVDPSHVHTWIWRGRSERCIIGGSSASSGRAYTYDLRFNQDAEIAVLKSLATPSARKAWIERLLSDHRTDELRVNDFLSEVNTAYKSNPNRTDWLEILKKHGYSP